jgi:dihydrolipoamide dehydrogenase
MKIDVAVVGGGPGGYVAARRAAQLGYQVAVVEGRHLGGVCLNRGCIPTKTMLQAVSLANQIRRSASYGVVVPGAPEIDYEALVRRRDEVVARLRGGLGDLLGLAGISVIAGTASFNAPNILAIAPAPADVAAALAPGGVTIDSVEAEHIIIATGSKPAVLAVPGADHPRVIDSDGVLALKSVPSSMLVLGAGPLGCEWSAIFAGLGCKVTLVEMITSVLPQEDPDVGAVLADALAAQGVTIHTGTRVASIAGAADKITAELIGAHQESITSDYVLVATGRLPLTEALDLKSAGVETEGPGWVKVDDYQRTSADPVLAIGDVTGKCLLAHVACRQAVVAVEKLAGLSPNPVRDDRIPCVVYTEPEVASVGMTEAQARGKGIPVSVGQFPNFANARAVTRGQETGFVKVVADSRSGKLVGVHMIGPEAGELIGDAVSALEGESTLDEVADVIRPHPTLCESLNEACLTAAGRPLFSV